VVIPILNLKILFFPLRCFVREKQLIGICQRDNSSHYDHIAKEATSIQSDISSFYAEYIAQTFPLSSYTFDVVRWRKDRVKLVDFNPFGEVTDGIFFNWDELNNSNFRQVIDFPDPKPFSSCSTDTVP
jgi:D123